MYSKYKVSILSGVLAVATSLPGIGMAQELRESVSVDGKYIRDILHPDRLNVLPQLMHFPVGDNILNYESRGIAANFSPSSPVIPASVWGADRDENPPRGYIELTMGSWLNSSLSAGYGIIRRADERLGVRLQHNSTSLWHPYGSDWPARFSYQESLGADYMRRFAGVGSLTASLQYHAGYFNYYGLNPEIIGADSRQSDEFRFPTQTLNDAALRLGWQSEKGSEKRLEWSAGLGLRHFAYRTSTRETALNLYGTLEAPLGQRASSVGFDAEGNFLFYGSHASLPAPSNYGSIRLTPHYNWQRNAMRLHVGLDLDMTFNADGLTEDSHYAFLHVAPDIRFDVAGKNVGCYLHILGGSELQTLASTSQLDPYRNPLLESTMPCFTPLDINLGVDLTPFSGFTARVNLQYKSTKYVPMGGWYMALLNYGDASAPRLNLPAGVIPEYGRGLWRYNLSGFGAQLKLSYSPSDIFKIEADGSYTPQHDKTGIFNGLDRPRWVLAAGATVRPIKPLSIGVRYEYRGVRNIYTSYADPNVGSGNSTLLPGGVLPTDEPTGPDMLLAKMRLPDITRLSVNASWKFSKNFSLTFEADNLIGSPTQYLPLLPGEGATFAGGLQWLF